jgi:hypothetical protein
VGAEAGAGGLHGYDGLISPGSGAGSCPSGAGCSSCRIPPNQLPMSGADGQDGGVGVAGQAGFGCAAPEGQLVAGLWVGGGGDPGADGAPGGGGGGGGAGNGVMTCCSGNGMDLGGLGGGGGAGTAGGGSFGVFIYFSDEASSLPLLSDNTIQRGLGGAGGSGGNAGVAGAGGLGGKGGTEGTGDWTTFCAGSGGNGGGGCGGASYGVFLAGHGAVPTGDVMSTTVVLTGGGGGAGGQGGLSLGTSGQSGTPGAFMETNF